MATRPTLPYFAPADQLPAPLPTVEEIMASEDRISPEYGFLVLRVGKHYAVKRGPKVKLQEGENMLFVQQNTNVPVPTVYAIFHDEKTNCNFIVMEYIPGKMLNEAWNDLLAEDKKAIASQLRRNMDELRSIPSPGYYGGIWRQPIRDKYFADPKLLFETHQDPTISGPQETEEDWAEAMWRCLDTRVRGSVRTTMQIPVRRRIYKQLFRGHEPVFTHADFSPVNLILREDTKTVVILDWQMSGWYPYFWEYCITMNVACQMTTDWAEWVPEIFGEEWLGELGWMASHRGYILMYHGD